MINIAFRKLTRAAIFLLPTLGVTWIFGVLAVNSEHVAFAWIFTILNSIEVYTVHTQFSTVTICIVKMYK